jgi:hypothetical protein
MKKGKAIPATGFGSPYGCETSRFPHFIGSQLTDDGEVVSFTRRPPFTPPGRFLVLISVRGRVDSMAILRLEELRKLKNAMTSAGFEPQIFRLVAFCLI